MEMNQCAIRSILIIDDDKDDYDLIREAVLEIDPQISVVHMDHCEEATPFLLKHFDLILLDINMPQHDGFYWLKHIRSYSDAHLPVIMYTNSLSPVHIARSYEEGANLYFSKPETFHNLIRGLRALIRIDWSDPDSVREQFRVKGKYHTFQYE